MAIKDYLLDGRGAPGRRETRRPRKVSTLLGASTVGERDFGVRVPGGVASLPPGEITANLRTPLYEKVQDGTRHRRRLPRARRESVRPRRSRLAPRAPAHEGVACARAQQEPPRRHGPP